MLVTREREKTRLRPDPEEEESEEEYSEAGEEDSKCARVNLDEEAEVQPSSSDDSTPEETRH